MTWRRAGLVSGGVALLAVLAIGLVQLAGNPHTPAAESPAARLTPAQMQARLAGSPAPLAALHTQANELLPSAHDALSARLRALHGQAVVVNKWASWCQPCRSEFAAFQRASLTLGRRVAFIGLDSGDTSRADALAFLRSFPVSYPSYYDPSGRLGSAVTDSSFMPVTAFYSRGGGPPYIKQGPYPSQAKLERDIRTYALGA